MIEGGNGPSQATGVIVACVDGSEYAASVCDHAAWLAGPLHLEVELLHVIETPGAPRAAGELLRNADTRLADDGVRAARQHAIQGSLIDAVDRFNTATVVVLGKRGESSSRDRRQLGSNAEALLRADQRPMCLVSQLYLPVHRALVIIDRDQTHRRTIEMVARNPALAELELEIMMVRPQAEDGEAKLTWARDMLRGRNADVYPASSGAAEAAAAAYLDQHKTDLIIMSREMLFAPERVAGPVLHDRPLWGWRTPIFVC